VHLAGAPQVRQLPRRLAQRIAFVLKGSAAGQPGGATPPGAGASLQSSSAPGAQGAPGGGNSAGGPRPGGTPDFQQMISRLPAVTLADLQKDEAGMIVSTVGTVG